MNRKVTVVGAGNVGATLAQRIADRELADVVLIDIVEGMPQGKGLDIMEAAPVEGSDARVVGTNDYKDTAGSDIVVITAGIARKPGMSRDDLLNTNYKIVKECTENVPEALAEPDPDRGLQPPRRHVPGGLQGLGPPQAAGLRHGGRPGHAPACGPSSPWSWASPSRTPTPSCWAATATPWCRCRATPRCAGIPITELLPAGAGGGDRASAPRAAAPRSSSLLKTGSAYYAPSSSTAEMVDAVLKDKHKILPCCCYLEGEFGIKGLYVGVPAQLGAKGVEKIWEIKLTDTRARRPREVRRGRQGAGRRPEAVAARGPVAGGPGARSPPDQEGRQKGRSEGLWKAP